LASDEGRIERGHGRPDSLSGVGAGDGPRPWIVAPHICIRMVMGKRRKHSQRKEQVISGGVSAPESEALSGETYQFRGSLWNLSDGWEMARKWPSFPNHARSANDSKCQDSQARRLV